MIFDDAALGDHGTNLVERDRIALLRRRRAFEERGQRRQAGLVDIVAAAAVADADFEVVQRAVGDQRASGFDLALPQGRETCQQQAGGKRQRRRSSARRIRRSAAAQEEQEEDTARVRRAGS